MHTDRIVLWHRAVECTHALRRGNRMSRCCLCVDIHFKPSSLVSKSSHSESKYC